MLAIKMMEKFVDTPFHHSGQCWEHKGFELYNFNTIKCYNLLAIDHHSLSEF